MPDGGEVGWEDEVKGRGGHDCTVPASSVNISLVISIMTFFGDFCTTGSITLFK